MSSQIACNNRVKVNQISFSNSNTTQDEIDFIKNYCGDELPPDAPDWFIAMSIEFLKKNPHYATTGCKGKKYPTSTEIKQANKLKKNIIYKQLGEAYADTFLPNEDEWPQEKCHEIFNKNIENYNNNNNIVNGK